MDSYFYQGYLNVGDFNEADWNSNTSISHSELLSITTPVNPSLQDPLKDRCFLENLPRECFFDRYKLNILKPRLNLYLSYISS